MIEQILKAVDDHLFAFIVICIAIGWVIRMIVTKGKERDEEDDEGNDDDDPEGEEIEEEEEQTDIHVAPSTFQSKTHRRR